MCDILRSFFIVVLLGFFTVASAQLPPEIMADKYLIEAEQLHAAEDYAEAFNVMKKIIALQKEHNLTLPDEFHFKYARVALSADSTRIALESVTRYLLATGKEGQFYKEALALLLEAEVVQETQISAEETCVGKPEGSSCWMALTNHPGCYVWNDYLRKDETATWSGECLGSVAQGEGTISWTYSGSILDERGYAKAARVTATTVGRLQRGKLHGPWVYRYPSGSVIHASSVHGKAHGQWVERDSDGTVTYKGSYVDGKKHGPWVEGNERYYVEKGSYVNGKRHGKWIERDSSTGKTSTEEVTYVAGKKHGPYIYHSTSGSVIEGSYADDERHGQWVERDSDGSVEKGSYADGKMHGLWVTRHPNGYKSTKEYINGSREGTWFLWSKNYDSSRECWSYTYRQDERVESKKVNKKMCR